MDIRPHALEFGDVHKTILKNRFGNDDAGFKRGDIITELNSTPIEFGREALGIIANMPPGTELTLMGLREGRSFEAKVTVAERPAVIDQPGNR